MSFQTTVVPTDGAGRITTYLGTGEITAGSLAQRLAHCLDRELSMLVVWAADRAASGTHVEALDRCWVTAKRRGCYIG